MMSRWAEFHQRLWATIEGLGTRCAADDGAPQASCDACDACQADYSAAARALFTAIFRHRPENPPDVPEGKRLFPGWRPGCVSCEYVYPCPELLEIARELGLEWDDGA